jgi:hypothetical protein
MTAVNLPLTGAGLKLGRLKLKGLIMCRSRHAVRLLANTLEQFDLRQDYCHSAQEASNRSQAAMM